MSNKSWKKRALSLYLAIVMLISVLPISALADENQDIKVKLSVQGQSHDGVLVGEEFAKNKEITVKTGDTVKTVIEKYAKENNVQITMGDTAYGAYLSSLHNLREKDFGDLSGWTYYVYNAQKSKYEMPDIGVGAYEIKKPEDIKLVYTVDYMLYGYQAVEKTVGKISKNIITGIDKRNMSGRIAAALYNMGEEIPKDFENVVRNRVQKLSDTSSVEEYFDTILSVLAVSKNPYNAWGRNLIKEISSRDISANGSVEDIIYAIAIINSGEFETKEGKWSVEQLRAKLETLQNADGSFGNGNESEKVILTAKVYNYAEFSTLSSKIFQKMEDYLQLQMHKGGGFPLSKENGLATAEVVFAMVNRAKDPDGRISYRETGNWVPGNVTPFRAFIDYLLESKNGFKKDLSDKEIDADMTELSTLAVLRMEKYYNRKQEGAKSIFSFGKIKAPTETQDTKLIMDRLYEEAVQNTKSKSDISEQSAYILKRMGEELSDEQKAKLESKIVLEPKNANSAYNSALAIVASGKQDGKGKFVSLISNVEKDLDKLSRGSQFNSAKLLIAGKLTDIKYSDSKEKSLADKLSTYILFKKAGVVQSISNANQYAGGIAQFDRPTEKANLLENIQSFVSTNDAKKVSDKNTLADLVATITILGEDFTDPKYTTKDQKTLLDLIQSTNKTSEEFLLAVSAYKLKSENRGEIFKYTFEATLDEKLAQSIEKHKDNLQSSKLPAHIQKKYDPSYDMTSAVADSKEKFKKKNYDSKVPADLNDIMNLLAGGENPQNIDGKDLINNLLKTEIKNKKSDTINTLIVLNSANFAIAPESKENKETLKSKVVAIKEFQDSSTGKYSLNDGALAIIALAPYYNEEPVKTVVDKFLEKASRSMQEDGTIGEFGNNIPHHIPYKSSELALFVRALIKLGIDPATDSRFIKKGKNLFDGLYSYEKDAGFIMQKGSDDVSEISTRDILQAFIDYKLFKEGSTLIYDYTKEKPPVEEKYDVKIIIQPDEAKDAKVTVTEKDKTEKIEPQAEVYKLKEGSYTVKVEKKGYNSQTKNFDVTKNPDSHKVEITLAKESMFKFDTTKQMITGYKTKNVPAELVIPSEIDGVPVKHIGADAFRFGTFSSVIKNPIKKLTLPEGLETIGQSAFQGNEFTEVTIPSTVTEIDGGFRLCKTLENVKFADGSKLRVVGKDSFYENAIKEINLPDTVEILGENAFNNTKLKTIKLPSAIKEVGGSAFARTSIQEIEFPGGIEKLNLTSGGKGDSNGIFFRTFGDDEKKQLSFTRIIDKSQKANILNTSGIVNPVEITFKYVDENGIEIASMPEVRAVGMNKKTVVDFGNYTKPAVIGDGDKSFIFDYKNNSNKTDIYTKDELTEAVLGNYFAKGQSWTFNAPEISGYTKAENVTKTLENSKEEIIFKYKTDNQKHKLTFDGDGINSDVQAGEYPINTKVNITIVVPENKSFKKLLINDEEVTAQKDGVDYKYSFNLTKATTVKVIYEDLSYDKEIDLKVDNKELKLGEKSKFSLKYRGQDVILPNNSIQLDFDKEILSVDENTGDVIAIGSGTVVLSARLKNNPGAKSEEKINVSSINVKLRVENVNETVIEPTNVEIKSLKVTAGKDYYNTILFKKAVPFLAVKNVLQSKGIDTSKQTNFDFSSDGNWMKTVASQNPQTTYGQDASFMLAVNNVLANEGAGTFEIKEGDYVVIFAEQNWKNFENYTYFEQEEYTVKVGEEFTARLFQRPFNMGNGTSSAPIKAKDVVILYNNKPLQSSDSNVIKTNSDGEFKHTFEKEGVYVLSAQKMSGSVNRISRPYAVVKVQGKVGGLTVNQVEKFDDIKVQKGTEKNSINLPETAKLTLSDSSTVSVDLVWDNAAPIYDKEKVGEYIFKASYELPSGVSGEKPEIACKVIVEQASATNPVDTEKWAKEKMNSITSHFDSSSKKDEWIVSELGKLGRNTSGYENELKAKWINPDGSFSGNNPNSVGDLSKTILALRSNGIDPEDFYGINLVEELVNLEANSSIWQTAPKLWALSSDKDYSANGLEGEIEKLVSRLLSQQQADGLWEGFGHWTDASGFVLYALAPYKEQPRVKAAIEKAVESISKKQLSNGDVTAGPDGNLNSLVIVAGGLWSIDPDYLNDPRFVKNGKTMLDAIKEYDLQGTPDFLWRKTQTEPNNMATEQTYRAFITLFETREGRGNVFDYTGTPKRPLENIGTEIKVLNVEKIDDQSVQQGTEKSALNLKSKAKVTLTNNTEIEVELSWDNATPIYNPNMAGEYIFKANYELPSYVTGDKPDITAKIIVVEISVPITIVEINPVNSVEVQKGTEQIDAISKLSKTTTIKDSKDSIHIVNLDWTIENYDKDVVADYNAVATFELPASVEQSNPSTELKVKTVVKVVDSNPAPNTANKEALKSLVEKIESEQIDKSKYTQESISAFEQALQKSKDIIDKTDATQEEVNDSLLELQKAKADLKLSIDKSTIEESVRKAKEKLLNKNSYREEGVRKLEEELAKAELLLSDSTATQDMLNEQAGKLNLAINSLIAKSTGGGGSYTPRNITVYFTLRSIEKGGSSQEIWIPRTVYSVPENSKVYDVFDKALRERGIDYINKGNYISEIKSPVTNEYFGEFSNGRNSGWMYKVNGKHTTLGLEQYTLSDNDDILWFYTNDYTKEDGSQEWNNGGGGGGAAPNQNQNDNKKKEENVNQQKKSDEKLGEKTVEKYIEIKEDIKFKLGSNQMKLGDKSITLDAKPFVTNGRTMIPLRAFSDALGLKVEYNAKTKTVSLSNENAKVDIPLNGLTMKVNGKEVKSDILPIVKNGRTYLSISNIAKAFGLENGKDLLWDNKTKTLTVVKSA